MVEELKLQVDVAEPPELNVTLVGEHEAVKPVDGVTDLERVRDPVKPFRLVSVTVDAPDDPTGKATVDGLATMLKLGGAITLTLIVDRWDSEPLVPVTVTV